MKNSKRLLATLLTLCIMASFVFTGTAFAADESAATLTFPAQIVNVNGTAKVELAGAGNGAITYESSDTAIAEVNDDGVVTGKAIGRVTITAKEDGAAIASVEIPVVGENLLIKTLTRNGTPTTINYGAFEAGTASYFNDKANRHNLNALDTANGRVTPTKNIDAFWWICTETGYADALSVVDVTTPAKESTKAVKYSMTNVTKAHQFAMRSGQYANNAEGYEHVAYGSVPVKTNKLYELSAWGNYADVKNFPAFYGRVYYKNADATKDYSTQTGEAYISIENGGWERLNTLPIALSDTGEESVYAFLYFASSKVNANSVETIGDIYVADVSFHEVAYAPVFRSNSGLSNVKVGFETSTQFQHLSNTGKEVISVDASGKKQNIAVTYDSVNEDVATVDNSGNITAVGAGEAVIQATATLNNKEYVRTITFTVASDEDQALVGAFDATINEKVSYTVPTVTGVTVEGGVIKASDSGDGTFTLTADAEKDGNKFLYWAKGKTLDKKIISFSNVLTNYMPEANDKNHILIAVYEGDVPDQEEWYNANGQRIAKGTKPEKLPSMAGYGEAEGWEDYTDKIHVARYARQTPIAGINVTVVDGNGSRTNLTYGDTVTCTADEEQYGTFKCWTKTGINGNTEIVSVDKEYKFQAWETCTVTALYDEDYTYKGNTMKIILDVFDAGNEKAVMAEFVGFGNKAVEKGIIWNGTKIAMTKPGTQFTLTGVAGDVFTGYAIVDNGNGTYNEVTDGSVTISE